MTLYRLFDGQSGRPGNGPALTAYTGNFLAGTAFQALAWGTWLNGYYWWVPSGGDTAAQKFVLRQITNNLATALIGAGTVTSGTLTAAASNLVALPAPVPLSRGVPYLGETGWLAGHGFPETKPVYGGAGGFTAGITNGPLQAYSDVSGAGGTNPVPHNWFSQGSFGVSSPDPAAAIPNLGSDGSANFWVDLLLSDTAPAGYTGPFRLFPNLVTPDGVNTDQALNFTLGVEVHLSQACTVNRIWFYSGTGCTQLPTETAIYGLQSQSIIPGTHQLAPSWSGAAGSGWISSDAGYILPAGQYKITVFNGAAVPQAWNNNTGLYWSTGPGGGGITSGPLSAPDDAHAAAPGQSSYHQGTPIHFPDTHSGPFNYWVDADVTLAPVAAAAAAQLPDSSSSSWKKLSLLGW